MYPVNNLQGIEARENNIDKKHVIIFLLVKTSDLNADSIIKQFNYMNARSGDFCQIYPIGYDSENYHYFDDIEPIRGINNKTWYYSDKSFVNTVNQLSERLKNWRYVGEPVMIILQNKLSGNNDSRLDFTNYCYIDINYAIKKGYIDSFPRFMERLFYACETETKANKALSKSNISRINGRKIIETAIELTPKLPKPLKKIMKDYAFFKTANIKGE